MEDLGFVLNKTKYLYGDSVIPIQQISTIKVPNGRSYSNTIHYQRDRLGRRVSTIDEDGTLTGFYRMGITTS